MGVSFLLFLRPWTIAYLNRFPLGYTCPTTTEWIEMDKRLLAKSTEMYVENPKCGAHGLSTTITCHFSFYARKTPVGKRSSLQRLSLRIGRLVLTVMRQAVYKS